MSITAVTGQNLYVLTNGKHYWLTTIATNRRDCWLAAKRFCREVDWRAELKRNNWRCVRLVWAEEKE